MNLLCIFLGLVLAWLPFSVGLFIFEIGSITFTVYIIALLLLVPSCFFNIYMNRKKYVFRWQDLMIVFVCMTFLISTVTSSQPVQSGYLAFHSIFVPVLGYFVIKSLITDERKYLVAYRLMLVGLVVFCFIAFIAFVREGMKARVEVFSRDSIAIATFSIAGLVYFLYSGAWKRTIGLAGTLVCLAGLISSLSRGYVLFLLFSPLIERLVKGGRNLVLIIVFLIITFFGTVLLSTWPDIVKPQGNYSTKYENTLERITNVNYWKTGLHGRLLYFRESLSAFTDSPAFGIGLRTQKGWGSTTVHNFHIEWLLYGGVFGYLLYALLFIFHFHDCQRYAKEDTFCAINLTTIVLIMINALANGLMHGVMPYIVFTMMGFNEARMKVSRNSVRVARANV